MAQHRRPSGVIERVGKSMRQSPTKDWGGRLPAMPKTISGAVGTPGETPSGNGEKPEVHQITLTGVANQDPGTPSGDVAFDRVGLPPQETIGFTKAVSEIGTNGQVVEVECELTGTLLVKLSLLWSTYRDGGAVTLTRIDADTNEAEVLFESGPLNSRYFIEDEIGVFVNAGDRIRLTVPG